MENFVKNIFNEMQEVQNRFFAENGPLLTAISKEIADCFMNGGKLYIFGNGGSAADAQHVAAEFINRFKMERPPLPCVALTTDTSILTSIGNDYSYDDVFEKQVSALAGPKDLVWGISTSGNSENVLKGLRTAAKSGVKTIGFTGKDGGKMSGLCDLLLISPSDTTARIQEVHIAAAHVICELVDEIMFGKFVSSMDN